MIAGLHHDGPWMSGPGPGLEDLAQRLDGWRVRGRYARGRCPCCESAAGAWVTVTQEGEARVGCFACDDWKGLKAAFGLDGGPGVARKSWRPPSDEPRDAAPDMVVDADRLDAVYGVFARHLGMSADRRRNVLGRDRNVPLSLRERMSTLIGPVPSDPLTWRRVHERLVADLVKVAPRDFLRRVPELSAREGGGYAVLPTRRGAQYFEPWKDEQGRVVALRAYMGKRAEGSKYLVTGGRTGPMAHFAFGVARAAVDRVPWVFTEGWMKAEVFAHHLGAVGVGFPGILAGKSWPLALEVMQRMAPDAPAYVAFDAEAWTTRLDLALPALQLAREIERVTGRPAGFAVWDTAVGADGHVSPKGIDDAIVAGLDVRLVDRSAFGAYLGPTVEAWEKADAA